MYTIVSEELVYCSLLDPEDAWDKVDHEGLGIHVSGLQDLLLEPDIVDNVDLTVGNGKSDDRKLGSGTSGCVAMLATFWC